MLCTENFSKNKIAWSMENSVTQITQVTITVTRLIMKLKRRDITRIHQAYKNLEFRRGKNKKKWGVKSEEGEVQFALKQTTSRYIFARTKKKSVFSTRCSFAFKGMPLFQACSFRVLEKRKNSCRANTSKRDHLFTHYAWKYTNAEAFREGVALQT